MKVIEYYSFDEARVIIKDWIKLKHPNNQALNTTLLYWIQIREQFKRIPQNPQLYYLTEWNGWAYWFGLEKAFEQGKYNIEQVPEELVDKELKPLYCSAQLIQDTFLKELCSYSTGDRSPLAV